MKPPIKRSLVLVAVLALGFGYGWFRFHRPGRAKDGWIPIGKSSGLVFAGEERNKITWQEADQVLGWTGRPRGEAETICFDGHRVSPFSLGRVISQKGLIIRFQPHRIEVFDLEHLRGEVYAPREASN